MWLPARELAGLPGLPVSERRTRDRLTELGVPSRRREGRGGGQEYDCAALPEETRAALAARQVASAPALVLVEAPAQPEPVAPVPSTQAPAAVILATRQPPSLADKAVADARARLVSMVHELEPLHGLVRACTLAAASVVTGGQDMQQLARTASQRVRGDAVSARTLRRWVDMHKDGGWWALLPTPQAARSFHMDDDVVATLGLYHGRDARFRKLSGAAKEVTRAYMARGEREYDSWVPLYDRARRALKKLGRSHEASVTLIKARHTGAERDARLPFQRRDTSNLAPLDVWVIDGHTFKAKVRHPDHGAPFAPELTLVLDAATRLIVGWSVNLSENVRAVGDALRHAVGQHGVPAILYGDNGAGETAKAMDCPIDGFCARLGIDHRLGIPGKPQGHGIIERSWQTHAINAARQFGSYQGKDVDSGTFRKVAAELAKEQRALKRAEATGAVIKLSAKAPSWQQFVVGIEQMVADYNGLHRHRGLPKRADGKRMTPAEAWAAKFDPALQVKPSQLELRTLFMPSVLRTAKRGEVVFFNQNYQAPELMRRDVDGREVSVRYDIHDPSFVMVYTLGGEFVCEARWNANSADFYPKPVIEMAREKRVAAAVKRREQQIETALRELGPTTVDSRTLLPHRPAAPASFIDVVATPVPQPVHAEPQAAERPAMFATAGDRYEWLMTNRDQWQAGDEAWLAAYTRSDAYADLREYYEGRGMGWDDAGDATPVFKSAL